MLIHPNIIKCLDFFKHHFAHSLHFAHKQCNKFSSSITNFTFELEASCSYLRYLCGKHVQRKKSVSASRWSYELYFFPGPILSTNLTDNVVISQTVPDSAYLLATLKNLIQTTQSEKCLKLKIILISILNEGKCSGRHNINIHDYKSSVMGVRKHMLYLSNMKL